MKSRNFRQWKAHWVISGIALAVIAVWAFLMLYFGEEIVIQNPALRVIFRIGPWSFLAFTLLDILVTAAYGRREKRKKVREASASQPEAEETSAK